MNDEEVREHLPEWAKWIPEKLGEDVANQYPWLIPNGAVSHLCCALAEAVRECESLAWWQEHGQELRNGLSPLAESLGLGHGDADIEAAPACALAKIKKLTQERDEARAVLRELEWMDLGDVEHIPQCPVCRYHKPTGHAPDCKLAALLKGEIDARHGDV